MTVIKTYQVSSIWSINVCEVDNRRFLMLTKERTIHPSITDYPIHYNIPSTINRSNIAYDNPEKIPAYIKKKVARVFELHPECKIPY